MAPPRRRGFHCRRTGGTYLLVTQGRLTSLALAPAAVLWGVLAGVSQASYTLLPRQLLRRYDETQVVGWAMLIGGVHCGRC